MTSLYQCQRNNQRYNIKWLYRMCVTKCVHSIVEHEHEGKLRDTVIDICSNTVQQVLLLFLNISLMKWCTKLFYRYPVQRRVVCMNGLHI